MSIELRVTDDPCGIVCDWGPIEYTEPRPEIDRVGHLMLVDRDYVAQLIKTGPKPAPRGNGTHSVTTDGTRLFAHHDYRGKRWTWELFETHWWDDGGPIMYLGRWPD